MHMYCMVRGNYPQVEQWKNILSTKFYPYTYGKQMGTTGAPEDIKGVLQMGVRPIQLFEITFPEPELNNVLAMIQPSTSWNPSLDKYYFIMRKCMGLEKLPIMPPPTLNPIDNMMRKFVDCSAIGLKKDRYVNGIEQV